MMCTFIGFGSKNNNKYIETFEMFKQEIKEKLDDFVRMKLHCCKLWIKLQFNATHGLPVHSINVNRKHLSVNPG